MGRIRKGVLGGFSGTVGTVIGGTWNGIDYMRSLPTFKKGRVPTQAQLEQQARFALGVRFIRSMADLFMITYNKYANKMTGVNTGLSNVLKGTITGSYPDYSILYSLVYISRGSLPNALSANATAATGGIVQFNWVNAEAGIGKEQLNDEALVVAYCPELNRAVYKKGSLRSALTDSIQLAGFAGKVVHTWITFISADRKDISDSIYTGQVTVVA